MFFISASSIKSKSHAFLKVENSTYDFGRVEQGQVIRIEYLFKNTGSDTLHIFSVEVTCGCTIADFPHYPLRPGDSGVILLTFDTKEKYDNQDRTIHVISNAINSPTKLRFKGFILPDGSEKK